MTDIQEKDKQRSRIVSGVIHLGIVILLIMPFLTFPTPPPGQEGVMVSFGEPDIGQGDDRPVTQQDDPDLMDPTPPTTTETEVVEEVVEETQPDPEPEPVKTPTKPKKVTKPHKKVLTSAEKAAIVRKKQQKAEKIRQKAEADAKAAEEARKRKQAEAKKKAAAAAKAKKEAELKAAKDKFGGAFNKNKGSGQGNTGKPGSQGLPNGDPNATKVGFGGGKVGGGLGDRGVLGAPKVKNTTNKSGRVTIKVCVNSSGRVISAEFTQKGSNTTNAGLIAIAKKNAKGFKFTKGGPSKQCGTISYNFKFKN